jgi:hypothetical protein
MISSAARRTARGVLSRNARALRRVPRSSMASIRQLVMTNAGGSAAYTTERVVELRSGKKMPTLYDATRETENCGVGLVASLKSIASRRVVEDADEMLVRMSHRGGCGCDPASGDGAGKSSLVSQVAVGQSCSLRFRFCFLIG